MSNNEASKYVKLVSYEGVEFFVDREVAISGSKTIKAMLEGNYSESVNNTINFPDIQGRILEVVIQYLYYRHRNKNSKGKIPAFEIAPELSLELMVASNYLDC